MKHIKSLEDIRVAKDDTALIYTNGSVKQNEKILQNFNHQMSITSGIRDSQLSLFSLKSDSLNLNPLIPTNSHKLKLNDHVNIDLDFELVQTLQVNHGGWCDAMFECIGSTGIIIGFDKDFDAEVIYPSGNIWTLNPNVFTLTEPDYNQIDFLNVDTSNTNKNSLKNQVFVKCQNSNPKINSQKLNSAIDSDRRRSSLDRVDCEKKIFYSINDLVEISTDLDRIKLLQKGHGEFCPAMISVIIKNKYEA